MRCKLGRFLGGPDTARHKFTRDECSRGGRASWFRTMAEVRVSMNLPLPCPQVRAAAEALLGKNTMFIDTEQQLHDALRAAGHDTREHALGAQVDGGPVAYQSGGGFSVYTDDLTPVRHCDTFAQLLIALKEI